MLTILALLAATTPATSAIPTDAWGFFGVAIVGLLTYLGTKSSERTKRDTAIRIERDKHEASMAAEKERLTAMMEAEKARLIAEKEKLLATLEAEKLKLEGEIEIENVRLANSRDASTQEEIKRIRAYFWETVVDLKTQIHELKEELRIEREYADTLREHIYENRGMPAPKRPSMEAMKVEAKDVMAETSRVMRVVDSRTGPIAQVIDPQD